MPLSSTELYVELRNIFSDAREYIRSHGYSGQVYFHITDLGLASTKEGPEFSVSNGNYGISEVNVKGKVLSDCVDEFCRRHAFTATQENLQIGPPIIEAEAEPSAGPREDDDELGYER